MKFNFKYTIIYVLLCLFLLVFVLIKYGKIENFDNRKHPIGYPKNALINYNDINSPLYSHNVNFARTPNHT